MVRVNSKAAYVVAGVCLLLVTAYIQFVWRNVKHEEKRKDDHHDSHGHSHGSQGHSHDSHSHSNDNLAQGGGGNKVSPDGSVTVDQFKKLSLAEMENVFYRYVRTLHTECGHMVRLGRMTDGGWEVCLESGLKLKANCLVYSFGINNIWDFDDGAARFGCEVHSFDPSMGKQDHKHSANVYFHNLGLDGYNGLSPQKWNMKTLGTIRKDLGHSKKVIDILKLDIEYSEWNMFQKAIEENALDNVKQLMFEIHTSMMVAKKIPMDKEKYIQFYSIFKTLEDHGFRMYWSTTNIQDRHQSPSTGKTRFCCFEIYWLNERFRKANSNNI